MPTVRVLVDKNRGEKYGIDYLTESDDEPEDEELQEKLGDHVKLTASDLPPIKHVMLAVGYIDRMKSFIVRNSWGENIVIFHITDPKYCRDAYSIRRLATDDIGYDNWCYDDHSDNSDEEEDNGNDFYIIDEEVKEKQEKQ
ncbi:unnamed protein product [Rotaria sp. Silwood2]|nr:unnamed protein product [Rotaria sp. Silwood2]